jgi:hypothetical protein
VGGLCTPTVSIFFDYLLGSPAPNPTSADQYGNFTVYAGTLSFPNMYLVQIVPTSGVIYSYVVNGPSCSLAGCIMTGPITAPYFNATTPPYFAINGTQISCSVLTDCSNLAKINAANVFTGSPQTAPIWNATTEFDVNGVALSAANLSNGTTGSGAIVLQTSPALVTPDIGAATGVTLTLSSALVASSGSFSGTTVAPVFNALTGFQVNGNGPLNHILVGNGTNYVDATALPSSALPPIFFQTVINGSHATDTPSQDSYLAVGPGTGMVGTHVIGVGSTVARTVLSVNATGGSSALAFDPYVVITAGAGTSGNCMQWDAHGGASDSGSGCGTTGSGSLTSSGYWVTPFGLIFEWGQQTPGTTTPTSYGLSFLLPHACFAAYATTNNGGGNPLYDSAGASCTTSTVTIGASNSTLTVGYLVVGW